MNICSYSYFELLQHWLKFARKRIYEPSYNNEIACYSLGTHGHWEQQANATAFAAFAVAAVSPEYDSRITGMSQKQILDYALKLMRFSLRCHICGPDKALDGKKWGHSWISALCIERMMHGIEAINDYLSPEDKMLLRNVLISECDERVDKYEVVGAIDAKTGNNKPESNIWNGAFLHRTALMYPDIPRTREYREKGAHLLLNGISIPSDTKSQTIYNGKPLSYWHVGPNFTEEFGLNHHEYLNIGYMVICLSNIAMLHFTYKKRNITAPEELYLHAKELWKRIKQLTFSDGRLWRVGGDTRARYSYCQDYAIPMWLLVLDKFGDTDVIDFEKGWLNIIEKEQDNNGDGSFLGERLEELEKVSPLYFDRLEGDRAVTLSMGAYWRGIFGEFKSVPNIKTKVESSWYDQFHGAMVERGNERLASFSWEACRCPNGMCLPVNDSSLAEWQWNLIGKIEGCADYNSAKVIEHKDYSFKGGFCTSGKISWLSSNHIAEGQADEITADENIAFAALPDDQTVLVMQDATTVNRTFLRSVKGLLCNIPNDIFNDKIRNYQTKTEKIEMAGCIDTEETLKTGGHFINIDDKLEIQLIYGADELSIRRPGRRQIMILDQYTFTYGRSGGNLYCDEICAPCITERKDYEKNTTLFDIGFAVSTTSASVSKARQLKTSHKKVKAVTIKGANGKKYIFIVNFGQAGIVSFEYPETNIIKTIGKSKKISRRNNLASMYLQPLESVLLESIKIRQKYKKEVNYLKTHAQVNE